MKSLESFSWNQLIDKQKDRSDYTTLTEVMKQTGVVQVTWIKKLSCINNKINGGLYLNGLLLLVLAILLNFSTTLPSKFYPCAIRPYVTLVIHA